MGSTPIATIIACEVGTPEKLLPLLGVLVEQADCGHTAFTWQQDFAWVPKSLMLTGVQPRNVRTLLDGVEVDSRPKVVEAGQVLRVEFHSAGEYVLAIPADDLIDLLAAFVNSKLGTMKLTDNPLHPMSGTCPCCSNEIDWSEALSTPDTSAKPGDVMVCGNCGGMLHWHSEGAIVEAPVSVLAPELLEALTDAQRRVRRRMPS